MTPCSSPHGAPAAATGSPGSCASCSVWPSLGTSHTAFAPGRCDNSRYIGPGMPSAIVVHELGGPEKLQFETVAEPVPAAGQALIRHTAIGLNFVDVYYRTGLYKGPSLPFTPGQEGAGIVEAVGPGVTELAVGDRVAYAGVNGAYAETRVIAADRLVRLPPGIDDRVAAAMMLKGMTAEYLLLRCA